MPLSALTPTCAFIPKYQALPFFLDDISGSRDPVVLLFEIREAQARLVAIADASPSAESDLAAKAEVEQFLSGLRHVWKEGEVRPTSQGKPTVPRGRRRPDPLALVTYELRAWFDEDMAQSGSELLSRLQIAHPDVYPDGLLRTVQRRLKIWRAARTRELVFGTNHGIPDPMAPDALRDVEAARVRGHRHPTVESPPQNEIREEHLAEATA